jgi:hypothetical protein
MSNVVKFKKPKPKPERRPSGRSFFTQGIGRALVITVLFAVVAALAFCTAPGV